MMTYDEALDFLNTPMYSQTRLGLGPIKVLLEMLGNPQDKLKYVHITGTNGKGSTAAFIESVLREAGYRTGLYTSPYIQRFTERMRVNGKEITHDDLSRITECVYNTVNEMVKRNMTLPTTFELITAIGFLYFFEQNCDIVILEVGLGGRLDATNIIKNSEVSVITSIDFDHMDLLGNTLEEIAYEKAGIIKEKGTAVSYPQKAMVKEVLERSSKERNAQLSFVTFDTLEVSGSDVDGQVFHYADYRDLKISLLGDYQIYNAVTALNVIEKLRSKQYIINGDQVRKGLEKAKWPGRLEIINKNPLIIIDGAHNPNGTDGLYRNLKNLFPSRKFIFIVGVLADKNYIEMFKGSIELAKSYLTISPNSSRALSGDLLAEVLRKEGALVESFTSIEDAVALCKEKYIDEVICAFGSLYFIGDVRTYCIDRTF